MKISEKPIGRDELDSILVCAQEAAEWLEIDLPDGPATMEPTPAAIVAAIDQRVFELQKQQTDNDEDGDQLELEVPDNEEAALLLASLWGQQLVRQFDWQWASVVFHDHDNAHAFGVFSADRSLAIYPFHFVFSCLEDLAPVTILLAFTILKDGSRIPPLPKQGYENVMDNVHHVIPRQ